MSRFWFGLVLLLASCASPRIGEVGPSACKGGLDEDHDGLIDCADPDCQNLDQCRHYDAAVASRTPDAGHVDSGPVKPPPVMDSGVIKIPVIDSGMSSDDDAGPVDAGPVDAGPPPPTCKPKCSATEACVDLACQPITASTSQTVAVTILSALAPNADPIAACLDGDCLQPSFGFCCPVDPYVRVVQIHADMSPDTVIGQTDPVKDDPTPMYGSPTWNVDLAEGDVLVFQVWDDNVERDDVELFECKPDLTNLMAGRQTCRDFKGPLYAEVHVTANLAPK